MKLEKLFLPLSILAAVIAVYVFFRGNGSAQVVTIPSTSSSGVPAPYTSQGVVQPINYTVASQAVQPSPITYLSDPNNTNPNGTQKTTPPYLNYNLGQGNLLNGAPTSTGAAPAATCGCDGCGGSCPNQCNQGMKNTYPDGTGNTPMATTRKRQVAASQPQSGWLHATIQNTNSYLANEGIETDTPTLTSFVPSGTLVN